jgi:CelD/BcsL family acetyltransferase involved in cellulose biosynthesis
MGLMARTSSSPPRLRPRRNASAKGSSPLVLERLDPAEIEWSQLDSISDRNVFQTREWVEFVEATQAAEPVVARVLDEGRTVAFFTGLLVRRFGVRILGSPFQGWATGYLGFNRLEEISSRDAVAALLDFAFGPLGCLHLELRDRPLTANDVDGLGFTVQPKKTFELELTKREEEIWAGFKSTCRTAIRKAQKSGVIVERASGAAFAEEYYAQLHDVFARQSLPPPYSAELVRELVARMEPTKRLLLLRARNAEGASIATGIFPSHGRMAYFWGGASWREFQSVRPNDLLMWSAIRYWREHGADVFDFGGAGDYKLKFGPTEVSVPLVRKSRLGIIGDMREVAKRTIRLKRRLAGRRLS